MNAEQRAVFQGIVYYYRENQVLCRYQATLKEAVAPALLQQALDAARPLAEYYFCHVVWEKREARLEPNTAPCRVRQGSTQPKIPEETNDYLFSLGYEGNTVYLDWFHFLADGRGGSPFSPCCSSSTATCAPTLVLCARPLPLTRPTMWNSCWPATRRAR